MSKIKAIPKSLVQRESAAELLQRVAADEEWQSMDEVIVVGLRTDEEESSWLYTATPPAHLHPALIRYALRMSEKTAEDEALLEVCRRKST